MVTKMEPDEDQFSHSGSAPLILRERAPQNDVPEGQSSTKVDQMALPRAKMTTLGSKMATLCTQLWAPQPGVRIYFHTASQTLTSCG